MVKGRNTKTLSIRLPDADAALIEHYAAKRGMTVSDWLKPIIMRAVYPGKVIITTPIRAMMK